MSIRSFAGALLVLLSALPIGLVAVTPPSVDERAALAVPIRRFAQVDARLFRSGQPNAAGFAYLQRAGVQTVISLRNDASERALVESHGMRFVHIPITFRPFGWGEFVPDAAVVRFFAIVDDPGSGIVFLHCQRGADRTGTFIGLYRIARQGWEVTRAYTEARAIGMRWWYFPVKDTMARLVRTLSPSTATQ